MTRSRSFVLALVLSLAGSGQLVGQAGAREAREQDSDEDGQPEHLPALPAGMTLDLIREGDELFRGKGGCAGCHGADATGMPDEGSALTAGLHFIPAEWEALDSLVRVGIPEPVSRPSIAMPSRGAMSDLTADEIRTVSAYVWAISQVRGEPWPGGHTKHPEAGHAGME